MPVPGTKLRPPRPRPRLVRRDRLANPFTDLSLPRLVLVAASAGFGKTTVVTQWLAEADVRVVWVTLDDSDADVHRFLTSCVAGVQAADHTTGGEARSLLEGDQRIPAEDVLAALVDGLDGLAGRTVIALDDCHRADSPAIHAALAFLVENLPPQVCVALATRTDPPLPLARMRTRGELVEVRSVDLRFTHEETAEFMREVMGLPLTTHQLDVLEERTEGWAAGLQLAGLSARPRIASGDPEELDRFIDEFGGSHRFVLDYLVEEVLDSQTEHARRFLLLTSVLEQLNGALCDAVTGRTGGQPTLERLERANVFVVALDDHRQWYRYHHLFAEALAARLRAEHPDLIEGLHHAASVWYAEHGMLDDAVRHAARASDAGWLADIVELALPELRRQRRTTTILEWLDLLPDGSLRERPVLAMTAAWARLAQGDVEGAGDWLDVAERTPAPAPSRELEAPAHLVHARDDDARTLPAMTAVYRAAIAQAHGDAEATVTEARRAQRLSTDADHMVRGAAAGFLALAAWADGDVGSATTTFTTAMGHLGAAGNVADQLNGTVVLADLALAQGTPLQARQLFEQALTRADADRSAGRRVLADLHVGLGAILLEQNDLAGAHDHLTTAADLGDGASFPENRFRRHLAQARLLAATGAHADALAALDTAESQHLPGFFPDVQPLHATRVRLWIRSGRLDQARVWADEHRSTGADRAYRSEYVRLTLARLAIVTHGTSPADPGVDRADAVLDEIIDSAREAGRTGSLVEALLVQALNRAALGDTPGAYTAVEETLLLAVPAGYRRLFLDEGAAVDSLLRGYLRTHPEGPARRMADLVLAGAERTAAPAPRIPLGGDRLSARELEVTALLATDLTGPEIAARLYVSINTLRTHTKHIFTKLDVKTRRAAVTRARELGLL